MIQDLTDERWALRPEHDWAFRALCDLDLHFEFLGLPRHAAVAGELLQRHPGLRCVLDHGLKPAIRERAFEPWASDMARLAGDSGALCKISGLVTEARAGWTLADLKPYVDHIVACFGPERVMWGSDWPVVNRNGGYDSWRAVSQALIGAHAGAHEILGEAAARFYRLSDQAS